MILNKISDLRFRSELDQFKSDLERLLGAGVSFVNKDSERQNSDRKIDRMKIVIDRSEITLRKKFRSVIRSEKPFVHLYFMHFEQTIEFLLFAVSAIPNYV